MRLASLVSTRVTLFKMAFYIHCDVEFWKSVIEKKFQLQLETMNTLSSSNMDGRGVYSYKISLFVAFF
jgi:hypothetical protein